MTKLADVHTRENGLINIFRQSDLSACEHLRLPIGECVLFTSKSPYKSPEEKNEDAIAVVQMTEHTAALIVSDGLGGYDFGTEAACMTVQKLTDHLIDCEPRQLRKTISDSLQQTSNLIQAAYPQAGATVTVAVLNGRTATICHAGDSETLICGRDGRIKMQTIPHSPVGQAQAQGVLSEHAAMFHEFRHIVSNAVGLPELTLEFSPPQYLADQDTLLLASDGLYDNFFKKEILDILTQDSLLESTTQLVSECRRRMCHSDSDTPHKPDDLSLVTFRLNQ